MRRCPRSCSGTAGHDPAPAFTLQRQIVVPEVAKPLSGPRTVIHAMVSVDKRPLAVSADVCANCLGASDVHGGPESRNLARIRRCCGRERHLMGGKATGLPSSHLLMEGKMVVFASKGHELLRPNCETYPGLLSRYPLVAFKSSRHALGILQSYMQSRGASPPRRVGDKFAIELP